MILIINICKERLHYYEFVKPIEEILLKNGINFYTKHYTKFSDKDLKADGIIICGTSLKDNDFLNNLELFKWIDFYHGKIFGVCGGMEILLAFYGGFVEECFEIGEIDVTFKKNFLSLKKGDKIKSYALHSKIVDIGDHFESCAISEKCIHAVNHKSKEFYGVMFHPEVRNRDILISFLKNCE